MTRLHLSKTVIVAVSGSVTLLAILYNPGPVAECVGFNVPLYSTQNRSFRRRAGPMILIIILIISFIQRQCVDGLQWRWQTAAVVDKYYVMHSATVLLRYTNAIHTVSRVYSLITYIVHTAKSASY